MNVKLETKTMNTLTVRCTGFLHVSFVFGLTALRGHVMCASRLRYLHIINLSSHNCVCQCPFLLLLLSRGNWTRKVGRYGQCHDNDNDNDKVQSTAWLAAWKKSTNALLVFLDLLE